MSEDRPIRWPGEGPDPRSGPSVPRVDGMTDEDARRIAERRTRHAAQDRAAESVAVPDERTGAVAGLAVAVVFVFAVLLPLLGFVLGIIGTAALGRDEQRSGQGLSIAAIVISVLVTPLWAVLLLR